MDFNKILKTKTLIETIVSPNILEKISNQNEIIIRQKLAGLGLNKESTAGEVYKSLIAKISKAEQELCGYLGTVDCGSEQGMQILVDEAFRLCLAEKFKAGTSGPYFIKEKKARDMLINFSPQNLLKVLGYKDINQLLKQENIFEIYGSLRFIETSEWMSEFIQQYGKLTHNDFEERRIKGIVLSKQRWHDLAKVFIKKKYHNLTHLKELGVVFAIPREVSNEVGIILTTFSLLLHYVHEVSFYAKSFKKLDDGEMGKKMIPIILGEIKNGKGHWRIVQRYLAKDKNPDNRAFEPHINPEAIFWAKSDRILAQLAKHLPGQSLDFWEDLDWIGDYFQTKNGEPMLLTFNSVDLSLSFANQKPLQDRYLYHYREALWNKIFSEIVGRENKMQEMILDNIDKGYIEL